MLEPPIPPDEARRLAALHELNILDTPHEERFDRITRVARQLFDVPISLVSLVDADRQWFKSCLGLDAPETPRSISFCGHAILSAQIFYVADAATDSRFADNPLVTGPPDIRFYAGAPLTLPGGSRIGTLCIIDRRPRQFTDEQLSALTSLAEWVVHELNMLKFNEAARVILDQELRLRSVLDNIIDAIITTDENGTMESVNAAAVRIFGYPANELIGKNVNMLTSDPQKEDRVDYVHNALRLGLADVIGTARNIAARRKDGKIIPVNLAVSEMRLSGRRMFVGIVRDISRRIGMEEKLKESDQRFKTLAAHAPVGIFMTDTDGDCIFINDRWCEFSGLSAQQSIGKGWMNALHPDDKKSVFVQWNSALAENREFSMECRFRKPNGDITWISANAVKLFNDNGEVTGYIGTASDITQRKQAEDEMRRTRVQLADAVEHLDAGFVMFDKHDRLITCNQRYQEMYSLTKDLTRPGTRYEDILREFCRQDGFIKMGMEVEAWIQRRMQAHRRASGVTEQPFGDRWVRINDALTSDGGIVSLHTDVTEHRHAEETLRRTTALQNAILDSANYSIISTDPNGVVLTFNAGAERMLGYRPEEVIGQTAPGVIHDPIEVEKGAMLLSEELGRPIEPGLEVFVAKARMGQTDESEWTYIRKNGTRFPVLLSVTGLRDSEGNITGFLAIGSDITERTQAREALRASEERYALAIRGTNDGLWDWNIDSGEVYYSPRFAELLGYKENEVVKDFSFLESHMHIDDKAKLAETVRNHIKNQQPLDVEFRAHNKSGEWRWLRVRGKAVWNQSGRAERMAGSVNDITERKNIERMKNEFVSTVSHELRTPLTSIRGSLGLIAGGVAGELPPEMKNLVDIAHKNSERLVRLINDILDMEKIESGNMKFDIRPVSLQTLVNQALEENAAYAAQYNVKITLLNEIPNVKVMVDADRFMQVMNNLLSNAAKFSPTHGVVYISFSQESVNVRIMIIDQGAGIPENFRGQIFQKFAQVDASDSRRKGGTGLGLSITKAIVERLGGALGYDSKVGHGTTFFVDLPVSIDSVDNFPFPSTEKSRILVCEDDHDVAALLKLMLEAEGYAVDVAYSAGQAVQRLGERTYAVMTLDIMLPDQDGISLIRELRSREETHRLPIVVVSAKAQEGIEELNGGAFQVIDWLDKPIDHAHLVRVVKQTLTTRSLGKPRILHVEDDQDICKVLVAMLGNSVEVVSAPNKQTAIRKLQRGLYDLVVLDINLPDGSGLDLLEIINKRKRSVPVLIFSIEELDKSIARNIAGALVKSRATNEDLLKMIKSILGARVDEVNHVEH